ncbi:hypothetical protein [Shinella sp.]|nr:hypothetical protein [Shinella sp.]
MSLAKIMTLTAAERAALIQDTIWLACGMSLATVAAIFLAWWFLYPKEAG